MRRRRSISPSLLAAVFSFAPAQNDFPHGRELLDRAPVAFVPNLGQWDHPARFVARFGAMTAFLEDAGWVLSAGETLEEEPVRGAAVRMRFVGGVGSPEIMAEAPLAGVHNYFLGNDPAKWRTGVERFARVRYRGLYPGVEVVCYEKGGRLEYDLLIEPGADLAGIDVEVEGAQGLRVEPDGALVVDTALGPLRQEPPVTYEVDAEGRRRGLASRHELRGGDRFGFIVSGWGGESPLVLDPGIQWSTFVGGSSGDFPQSLSVDASGAATIAGPCTSVDYPTTLGAWDTTHNGGPFDVFVTRLDPSQPTAQQLVYATYVGGNDYDSAQAISVDPPGRVTITGFTFSTDYPTTAGAWDTTYNGVGDAFVTRLDPSQPAAQQLVYSTFVGESGGDRAYGVSLDASGVVTIAGATDSPNFPTTAGAWDTTVNGGLDAFVTRLDPSQAAGQQVVYSTFVGGSGIDEAYALGLDASGVVTITGRTFSANYPTTPGAWDTTFDGYPTDVFVTRLDPSQAGPPQLVYSTFLGGGGIDVAYSLSVDATGAVTIAGATDYPNFPTTLGAWDTTVNGDLDAFVTRLDPSQPPPQQLLYSTFVGGSGSEQARTLWVGGSGVITIAGSTTSAAFPTTAGAWDTTHNGSWDAFVTRLDPSQPGSQQVPYSTFVGGGDNDRAYGISVDTSAFVTIAGLTTSANYPTTPGAWDTTINGSLDAFVTRLDMFPTGASPFGSSTPGCAGPLAIGVTSMPQVGNATFAIRCTSAPSSTTGLLAFSGAGLATPLAIFGAGVWVDPASPAFFTVFVPSNGVGAAQFSVPIPGIPALAGAQAYAQFAWLGPSAPPPCPATGVSTSNALEITIQP